MTTLEFNDTTDFQGLVQGVDFECGTDRNDYPLVDLVRNINFGLDYIKMYLAKRGGSVQSVESVTESFDVTSGTTKEITIAGNFMSVIEVSIDDDGGTVTKPELFDPEAEGETLEEMQEESGTPLRYTQEGQKIKFDKTFDFTKVGAIKVKILPFPTFFDSADTSETADLPRSASEALILYASYKWLDIYQRERGNTVLGRLNDILDRVVGYQNRLNPGQTNAIRPMRESNR